MLSRGDDTDSAVPTTAPLRKPGSYRLEILLISFSALLLEIGYTRIVSFKLYYYYTYLVIGLALLGLGCGAVLVAIWDRVRRATTDAILQWGLVLGALSVLVGYLIVARLPLRTMAIWDYGTAESFGNLVRLIVLCLALFATFAAIGVMLATLFGRRPDEIGHLYCADLIGAGLASATVVPLMSSGGPASIVCLAGLVLALAALRLALRGRSQLTVATLALSVLLGAGAVVSDWLPDVRVDEDKAELTTVDATRWSPVSRVDVSPFDDRQLVSQDGLLGSVILRWDGDQRSLSAFEFEQDPRSLPFDTIGAAPESVLIIGAAAGHEVLASLAFGADRIDAVELEPGIHDLVTGEYADIDGRFFEQPGVDYLTADGRAFLARSDDRYDVIWYPAPSTYAAANAASTGAFVMSESYLYTSEAITDTLDHLSPDGILVAQFGELNFDQRPNRTTRYVGTVRHALEERGIDDPSAHVLVASSADVDVTSLRYSTVLVKQTPFTAAEILRFAEAETTKPRTRIEHLPHADFDNTVNTVLTLPDDELDDWYSDYPYDVSPVADDAPFFWHFARFADVLRDFGDPVHPSFVDPEDAVGERVLLLLLAIATGFAVVFLLLPFAAVRNVWTAFPRKGTSATYFAALGFGFMFFEITLIQRLVLFLGYPTYSLTVTLASLLVFTGVGALLSQRYTSRVRSAVGPLAIAIVVLTAAYLVALPRITEAWLNWPLGLRVVVVFVLLAPLGLCLGMFMPLGITTVARLSAHSREYVAWAWAVNGFAAVVGSVLTTIIAMALGFGAVLVLAVATYLAALVALRSLATTGASEELIAGDPPAATRVSVPT